MNHCINSTDFSIDKIKNLIKLTENIIDNPQKYSELCKGKQLATLFFEPSTRTRLSFTSAMLSLGGQVIGFDDAQSTSASKGETLADTVRVISNYADIIAIRHPKEGSALVASQYGDIPVINAGDGSHSHPTQTLTDLFTIYKELGRLDNLIIGLCGDLKYGRTVYSLINVMKKFKNIHFVLIPVKGLELQKYILEDLRDCENISFSNAESIIETIDKLDVLYMTRIQKERFTNDTEYNECKDKFILNAEKMKLAKSNMIVLHPLPRVDEININVDNDPRAVYFRQAGNGKYIRMALILTLLESFEKDKNKQKLKEDYNITNYKCSNAVCISNNEPVDLLSYFSKDKSHCAYCDNLLE